MSKLQCMLRCSSKPVLKSAMRRCWAQGCAGDGICLLPLQRKAYTTCLNTAGTCRQNVVSTLQDKDYAAAAALAFEVKQPGRLLAVVHKAYEAGPAQAHLILASLVKQFDQEQLKLCLEYIRDWNTNSRHCNAAQATLQALLVQHQPEVRACRDAVSLASPVVL